MKLVLLHDLLSAERTLSTGLLRLEAAGVWRGMSAERLYDPFPVLANLQFARGGKGICKSRIMVETSQCGVSTVFRWLPQCDSLR